MSSFCVAFEFSAEDLATIKQYRKMQHKIHNQISCTKETNKKNTQMHTNTVKINEKEYFIWKTDTDRLRQTQTCFYLYRHNVGLLLLLVVLWVFFFFSLNTFTQKKHSVHTNIHTSCMRFLLDIFTMVLVGQFVHIVPIASICVTCYLLNYVQNLCIRKMIVATTTTATRYFMLLNENNNKNNNKWSNRISTIKKMA